MSNTLILIASRAGARFFSRAGMVKTLTPLTELDNPQGRLQEHELTSSRHGSNQESAVKHGYSPHQTAVDRTTENFAREVSKKLASKLNDAPYSHCYVVAEPHFLGKLRAELSKDVLSRCETIGKDFAPLSQLEIADRIPLERERLESAR